MGYFDNIYSASPDKLPHRARVVYMYLRDRAGKKSYCWPAINTIASDLQLSCSTVRRAIKDLIKVRMIEKESRFRQFQSPNECNPFLF